MAVGPDIVPFVKANHDRSGFSCGEEPLDRFLREQVTQMQRQDGARTYVICDDNRVVGYYSVSMYSIEAVVAPAAVRQGGYPVPGVLLGKLAVDERYKGRGLGEQLLLDAVRVAAEAAKLVGSRIMVVDALHKRAAEYYLPSNFIPFEDDPLKLYMSMKNIRRTLEVIGLV